MVDVSSSDVSFSGVTSSGSDVSLSLRTVARISEIGEKEWDSCAGEDHPFTRYAFLAALEDSKSAVAASGWMPHHLVVESPDPTQNKRPLAIMPLYIKGHSYGEYVFDHSWANAYERAGGQYYPKLQSSIPFTPVPGKRLLVRQDLTDAEPSAKDLQKALLQGLCTLCDRYGVSSAHITFLEKEEWDCAEKENYLLRLGEQFHWQNNDYECFDDFLGDLASRKRKNIRKERQQALTSSVRLEALTGDALKAEHWDAFYQFYLNTSDRKWGSPYLERAFFHLIGETMANQILLVLGKQDGEWVCGALNFFSKTHLYGRNWGSLVDYPFLHFEACYYQAIDFAIAQGLKTVEAGAQGTHKLLRGYRPVPTYSAHYIPHQGFRDAVNRFLSEEKDAIADSIERLHHYTPFRKGAP